MTTKIKMQEITALLLIVGTILSIALVLGGGTLYLIQNGQQTLQSELLQADAYQMSARQILHFAVSFSPLGIVTLGLFTLVLTQVLRVALLTFYYAYSHDYWFTCISFFILLVLLYSLLWRD